MANKLARIAWAVLTTGTGAPMVLPLMPTPGMVCRRRALSVAAASSFKDFVCKRRLNGTGFQLDGIRPV